MHACDEEIVNEKGIFEYALWLAEYLKRVTEMLRPLPYLETHIISMTTIHYSEN